MELVKTVKEFSIYKKKNNRFCVKTTKGNNTINGEKKQEILLSEGLIKLSVAKAKPVEEAPAEETVSEEVVAEAPAEEVSSEETPAAE